MYDRSTRDTPELLDSEVTCYFQLVKATKNNTVQARTDRLLFTYKSRRISGGAKRKLPEETVQKIFNHPKFSKVDNFPDFNPTPIIEFSNLQTQAVTPLMTIVEEASQLPTVLVKPQEVGVMFDPGNPVSSLEHLSILSPASNTQDNCLLQHASVLSPHQAQSVLSPQHVQSVLSPQHAQSVLSPQHVQSVLSPHQAQSVLSPQHVPSVLSPQHVQSNALSPQYYGSSPQRQSPRSRSRSPVPQPSQEMPYLPDLMNDLEDLLGTNTTSYTNNMTSYYGNLDNIVTDGPKRDKKQNSKDTFKKEVKKEDDMLDKMSKLNI